MTGAPGAEVLNELAVAHMERAARLAEPLDAFVALDYVERAALADTSSEIVHFNRAVLLERTYQLATVPSTMNSIAGVTSRLVNRSTPGSWRSMLTVFYEIGDYQFNSPHHHGTPDERLAAAQAGFSSGAASAAQAFELGWYFVN